MLIKTVVQYFVKKKTKQKWYRYEQNYPNQWSDSHAFEIMKKS